MRSKDGHGQFRQRHPAIPVVWRSRFQRHDRALDGMYLPQSVGAGTGIERAIHGGERQDATNVEKVHLFGRCLVRVVTGTPYKFGKNCVIVQSLS